jgi:PTH1 family peptidyl-tRNA hydrolase
VAEASEAEGAASTRTGAKSETGAEGLKLIVGLGNPGIQYAFTPHNLGFLLIDELASRSGARIDYRDCQALIGRANVAGHRVLLAKPETMMNLSGLAVRELMAKYGYGPEELMVVYDELDLPFGAIRIRERGSAGTHNGMRSVVGTLGTRDFLRVRLGIAPDHQVGDATNYVLNPWKKAQLNAVSDMITRAADAVEMIFREGVAKAMSIYNAAPENPA